uniref:Uncharacterized protein n=1 Tax=Rhizophora mucronata TaxID=61149 RepID=A0A2P2PP79_RHIMU
MVSVSGLLRLHISSSAQFTIWVLIFAA